MTTTTPTYTILSRSQLNRWDAALQSVVAGWELAARWEATGTVLRVFVPDAKYTPDGVDATIRAAGAKDEAIEKLGG